MSTDQLTRKIVIRVHDDKTCTVLEIDDGMCHEEFLMLVRDFRTGGKFFQSLQGHLEPDLYTAKLAVYSPNVPCPDCGTANGYAAQVAFCVECNERTVVGVSGHRPDCTFICSIREEAN